MPSLPTGVSPTTIDQAREYGMRQAYQSTPQLRDRFATFEEFFRANSPAGSTLSPTPQTTPPAPVTSSVPTYQVPATTPTSSAPTTSGVTTPAAPKNPVPTGRYTPVELEALQKFANSSEAQKASLAAFGGDLEKYGEYVEKWWTDNIESVNPLSRPADAELLKALGYDDSSWVATQPDNPADDMDVPIEQFLGNSIIDQYILPELGADATTRKDFVEDMYAKYQPVFDIGNEGIATQINKGYNTDRYLAQYPDVKAWAEEQVAKGIYRSLGEAAAAHYDVTGRTEGRGMGMATTSQQYADERSESEAAGRAQQAALDKQTAANLASLGTQMTDRQGALQNYLSSMSSAHDARVSSQQQDLMVNINQRRDAIDQQVAAQKGALQQQLAELNSAQSTYSEAERQALATQIQQRMAALETEYMSKKTALDQEVSGLLANQELATQSRLNTLDREVATKRTAIEQQLAALGTAQDTATQAKRAALQQQLQTLQQGIDAEVAARGQGIDTAFAAKQASLSSELESRKSALTEQYNALSGAIDTASQAKQAALAEEINSIIDAQQGVDATRLRAAQNQMGAVNMGVESTRDQIMAAQAAQGYVGGSAGTDAALARATIQGRQQAAGEMGSARLANANDARSIAREAASGKRSIADSTTDQRFQLTSSKAGDTRNLSDYGAAQNRGLSDATTEQRQGLTDYAAGQNRGLNTFGANQTADISNTDAAARQGISTFGANENRALTDFGATGKSSIFNTDTDAKLAVGNYGVSGNRALAGERATGIKDTSMFGADQGRAISSADATARLNTSTFGANQGREINDFSSTNKRELADFETDSFKKIADDSSTFKFNLGSTGAEQTKGLADAFADAKKGISDTNAAETRATTDSTTQRNLALFSNDTNRRLQALSAPLQMANTELAFRNALDEYKQSGLQRSLGNLGFFNLGTSQAANTVSTPVQANTAMGDALGGLGAGLVSMGGQLGAAGLANYFKPSVAAPVATSAGSAAGAAAAAAATAGVGSLGLSPTR